MEIVHDLTIDQIIAISSGVASFLAAIGTFLAATATFLTIRVLSSMVLVPILEELFWRGWLMRWLINNRDFLKVPLGTYSETHLARSLEPA